jgi:hypothetical protein
MTQHERTWLEEFEHNPPAKFPISIEFTLRGVGKQLAVFDDADMLSTGLQYAKTRLPVPEREDINEAEDAQNALVLLWRKLAANDFFKAYGARKVSNANIVAHNNDRAERLRRQRAMTLQRLRRDIDDLRTRSEDTLTDPDISSVDLLDLARVAGSIHTRLRQMGMAAERREWNTKGEDE